MFEGCEREICGRVDEDRRDGLYEAALGEVLLGGEKGDREEFDGAGELKRDIEESLSSTMRLRCVRLLTRCRAEIFSFVVEVKEDRLRSSENLAVSSSSCSLSCRSSSSSERFAVLGLRLVWDLLYEPLNISDAEPEAAFLRALLPLGLSSPTLPLPVELVAGGEGRPEPFDDALGLAGRTGSSGGEAVEFESSEPINMADRGRL